MAKIQVHLFDGTFELCRGYFGAPLRKNRDGEEVGASRSLLRNLYQFVTKQKNVHAACAFDHVIESFRNKLFDGYKTGEGMDAELVEQMPTAEKVSQALGMVTWPMKKFEADDAIAAGAFQYAQDPRVSVVYLCTPDKDLAQIVQKKKVILYDRLREKQYDEKGVIEKFGVGPCSIPDLLALIGDTADGIPGIPKWGAKSASTLLAHYRTIENIPEDFTTWKVKVRGAEGLATTLNSMRKEAALYKKLATLRTDVPLKESLDDLKWQGLNRRKLKSLCQQFEWMDFFDKIPESQFSI